MRLAWFVSPHGFGHAARSCAVLDALQELDTSLEVTLYTSVPRWFFEESLGFPFGYRELVCDVGLVQKNAVEEDLPATVERLETFWTEAKGFHRREIRNELRDSGAQAVVCDIAPLGLLAAKDAGLPSILLESFTWDWIYEPLVAQEPRFAPWVARMRELFALAALRIRAAPYCGEPHAAHESSAVDRFGKAVSSPRESPPDSPSFPSMESLSPFASFRLDFVPPIARRPRSTPAEVRARLGLAPIESGRKMILVSMGGIPWSFASFEAWTEVEECDFVVPGGAEREERRGNLVLLPHHSPVYHPDLVAAADAVVGKLGYSTVAEAVAAGTRFLFPPRRGFREQSELAQYVAERLSSRELPLEELASGNWVARLSDLLRLPRTAPTPTFGAAAAARAIAAASNAAER